MRLNPTPPRGFALIIVMTVIFVLAILAGGFAYSMKVETRLAANANNDSELEWMGRSGVEMAKYVLDQSMRVGARYTSLNQLWAGGPGDGPETNSPLAGINLRNHPLGEGFVTVHIADLERKININRITSLAAAPGAGSGSELIQRALSVMGVDAGQSSVITDSILDWKDQDDATGLSGTESDYYLGLDPPYYAKNGPFDDLAELLLVNGVTPQIYWGPRAPAHQQQFVTAKRGRRADPNLAPTYPVGLVDLFTPISSGAVNINTASMEVLEVALGVTDDIAANIIRARAGLDGVEGTDDDTPFQTPALAMVPGLEAMPPMARAPLTTVSSYFKVTVEVHLGNSHRECVAIVGRGIPGAVGLPSEGAVKVLQFSWR